jgi:DNA-binding NtrC family response regulator
MATYESEDDTMNDQTINATNPGLDILIVDDDSGTARTTALILDRKGHTVETASSGPEALEMVQARPFDLILLDIKMPLMNGVETHRRIKEIRPQAVVVMMTAYAVEELIDQALKDGAHDILYKPLDFDRLLRIIREANGSQCGALVLVVDDNAALRDALGEALDRGGYVVTTAQTGEEALAIARERPHDILFIDLKLPTINGLETYLSIREVNPQAIAVIMTGYPDEMGELLKKAMEQDAYTYLQKPFDIEDVLELAQEIARRKVT